MRLRALGWTVLAGLALGGLLLESAHRAPGSSLLAWFSMWMLGGGLAVVAGAQALALVLPDRALPAPWAPVLASGLLGLGFSGGQQLPAVLAVGIATALLLQLVERELPGWGTLAGWIFALCPVVLLAPGQDPWACAALVFLLGGLLGAQRGEVGLIALVLAGCLDPAAGLGAAGWALATKKRWWWVLPGVAAFVVGGPYLVLDELAVGPARLLLQHTLALGWPFGLLWMFGAAPRWQALLIGGVAGSVLFGGQGTMLVVPVVLGSLGATVEVLQSRSARAFWVATVLVVAGVDVPRILQVDTAPGILVEEDE